MVEERRRARAACDLEGNRAGLGCLEHLGNALSFAVVTEWPVRVYPRHPPLLPFICSGRVLPKEFWEANEFGVKGGIESAFMSTTLNEKVACLLYTSPSPRDYAASRMPSSA